MRSMAISSRQSSSSTNLTKREWRPAAAGAVLMHCARGPACCGRQTGLLPSVATASGGSSSALLQPPAGCATALDCATARVWHSRCMSHAHGVLWLVARCACVWSDVQQAPLLQRASGCCVFVVC
jgi:hypothetical protein